MKASIKKILLLILSFIIILSINGCANIESGTDIDINKDGSTTTIIRLSYDSSLSEIVGEGLLSTALKDSEFNINKTDDGQKTIEEAFITTPKMETKDIAVLLIQGSINKNTSIENEYITASINRDSGFFTNKFTINIDLNKDIFGEVSAAVDKEVDILGTNVISNYLGSNIKSALGSIPYTLKLSLPVKVTDSNSSSQLNSRTLIWNYTLKDLTSGTSLMFSFTAPNLITITIASVIIIILLIIVIINIFRKRR